MATSTARRSIKSVVNSDKRTAIMEAISSYDVASSQSWDALDQLSSRTKFESIDAVPDGIFEVFKEDFEAIATVYVTLQFEDNGNKSSMSDSYPVNVQGTYEPGAGLAKITEVSVDTSSFYS